MSDNAQGPVGATPVRTARPDDAASVRTGRPSSFCPSTAETIVRLVRGGNFLETAAGVAGVSAVTARAWAKKGARARRRVLALDARAPTLAEAFEEVAEALLDARGWNRLPPARRDRWLAAYAEALHTASHAAEARNVGFLQKAAAENVAAAQWFLERRFPERWARQAPQRLELSGPQGSPIAHELAVTDPAALHARLAAAAARAARVPPPGGARPPDGAGAAGD